MTCNFRVGQKVVCVRHDEATRHHGIRADAVYTVSSVSRGFVNLNEARGSWLPIRFRPVVQRKTDISIFKALLTPSKEKVETAP